MSCTYYINKHDGVKGKKSSGAGKRFIKTSQGETDELAGGKKRNNAARILSLLPALSPPLPLSQKESRRICRSPASCGAEVVTSRCLRPLALLTSLSVPGAPRLKSPGRGRQAGAERRAPRSAPTLEKSSRRPDFF